MGFPNVSEGNFCAHCRRFWFSSLDGVNKECSFNWRGRCKRFCCCGSSQVLYIECKKRTHDGVLHVKMNGAGVVVMCSV